MTVQRCSAIDEGILHRVYSEFLEMPGLRLTCEQAQRLWALDGETCRALLDVLVEERFLCRPIHGMYSRLSDGPPGQPRPRSGQGTSTATSCSPLAPASRS